MALDATVAGTSADSYLEVADADLRAAKDRGPEADLWRSASTIDRDREQALQRATSEIDGWVRTGYSRHAGTQALRFPRSIDLDANGDPIIPRDILQATYLQAAYVLKNATTIDSASRRHAQNVSHASEPNLQHTAVSQDQGVSVMSPRALHFLSGYSTSRRPQGGTLRSSRIASGFPGAQA